MSSAEEYSDMIRKICFEYAAGGYNSDGLLPVATADSKLRWVIEDMQARTVWRGAHRINALESSLMRLLHLCRNSPDEAVVEAKKLLFPDAVDAPEETLEQRRARRREALNKVAGIWKGRTDIPTDGLEYQKMMRGE